MTRLPTPLHRSYARTAREYGPWSVPGLVERWPIAGGKLYTDSAATTPAGATDPLGAWKGALGALDWTQATTAKKPTVSASGPAVTFDMVDDLLRTTYALSMGSRWAIAMAVWGRDDTDKFVLRAIGGGFTNLVAEYAVQGEQGDNLQYAVPANFLPDGWRFAVVFQADWANSDGLAHPVGALYADASNSIEWGKNAAGDLYVTIIAAGTTKTATLTKTIAAGAWVFLGARLSGGTLTIYADTDSDGDVGDNTATATSVPASTGASWTYHHMANQAASAWGEGAANLVLVAGGSYADPITDRFNAGAGMALAGDMGWLAQDSGDGATRNAENLVLHVGGNADGSAVQVDTAQGATDLLAGTATGRVDLSAGNYLSTADPGAAADSLSACSWGFEWDNDGVTTNATVLSRGIGSDNQFAIRWGSAALLRVYVANGASDISNYADFTLTGMTQSDRLKLIVTYNAGTVALYAKKLDPTTRKYGAQIAPSASVTGSIPATLRASAAGYVFGGSILAGVPADGQLDDVRIWYGKALTSTEADADLVNEPNPAELSHWWPFDGDGVDVIGGLTASWTGTPAYVDDGRHHLGRFERFTKQGQYSLDGVDDYITHGNYATLNGATQFACEMVLTPRWPSAVRRLLGRGVIGTDGQLSVRTGVNGTDLVVLIPTSAADSGTYGTVAGMFTDGAPVKVRIEYDGGLSAVDRLKVWTRAFDAAMGTWGTETARTVTITGTIPTALLTTAGAHNLFVGADPALTTFTRMLIDRLALHAGGLPASKTPYESGAAAYDIWCDYNGGATNAGLGGATHNGTVTGAIQWYDGRQLEGWTPTNGVEVDRATGASQSSEGTYGIRYKVPWASTNALSKSTPAVTSGRWVVMVAHAREVSGSGSLRMHGTPFPTKDASIPAQASLGAVGRAERAGATDVVTLSARSDTGSQVEAYFDDLRALQLAVVSVSVATKGVPSRVIWSASKNGATLPYAYAAIATDEKLEIGVRNAAGTRTEASSSGAVTTGVHSLILEFNGTNTLKAYLDTVEVASVAVSGSFTGLDRLNLGGLVGYLEGHPFDERIAEPWLHAGASFPGYSAIDRTRLHNYLAARVTGLVAV